jgi:DNA-binding NtrC family response regulator
MLPPLRERDGDIRLLIDYYVDRFNREFRKKVRGLSDDAMALLEHYRWPGNIRELRNAIERAMLLVDREWLTPQDFPSLSRHSSSTWTFRLPSDGVNLEDVERQLLVQALDRCGWNQTHAGQLLRINRDQVRYRIEKFGLRSRHDPAAPLDAALPVPA